MAGHKSPRVKDDKAKKRKRDANDGDTKSKRHRQQLGNDKEPAALSEQIPDSSSLTRTHSTQTGKAATLLEFARNSSDGEAGWRVSKPMGGRMLDIDPILTADDQYLILTYNTSIQVYNALDSLLVRRIPICALDSSAPQGSTPIRIVAVRLSRQDPDFLWVACSDGHVYRVNWITDTDMEPSFQTSSGVTKAMTIIPAANQDDIVILVESDKNRLDITAYQGNSGAKYKSKSLFSLKWPGAGHPLLEASEDGQVLMGTFNDRIFLGARSKTDMVDMDQLQYGFYSFDTPDLITTIDMRCHPRLASLGPAGNKHDPVVDILAGGARGGIYVYRDALARIQAIGQPQHARDGIQVSKFHWHRKAVHSAKWSRDGNYFISGGSENVLVIWQVDTSRKDFLPHLSASVENIAISASGSSYILHLDDNSAMIISTAEMKPTAFVSGIQTATVDVSAPKDSLVKRVWTVSERVDRPIPAAIRPTDSSKLHVCVGNGRQVTMSSGHLSAPLLQTFDLESFTGVSKQALARTQLTDVNLTNKGHAIDEPLVSHISFTNDGRWLASVDVWQPPAKDVENVSSDLQEQFIRERHEVYLKFWQVSEKDGNIALVSRVNAPHSTSQPENILDLVSHPTETCFASIGGDGIIRLWRARSRLQNGVPVKGEAGQDTLHWICSQTVAIGGQSGHELATEASQCADAPNAQGSLTFSEDGSTLFAAFGTTDAGLVYVIDTATGQIIKSIDGLWEGHLHSIRALSSFIVTLSDELRVYDVVGDELRYGIVVPKIPRVHELLQLAVDRSSTRFAVTLPIGDFSSVGIFDPEDPEPLLVRSIPHRIVSLVSSPSASGFVAVDDTAQVWVIAEGSDPSSLATMQPLEELRLDKSIVGPEQSIKSLILNGEDAEMGSDDDMDQVEDEDTEDMEMDDVDAHPRVVPQQYLADIFDATPAFAAPSVEDMFYKVADLLAAKPLSVAST
ncbi:hypothetical protein HIM_03159 [Hirsutella minnesotensis 3608]|nr:hypothetical protein HIM_03159 [Hirsutella minnesotensis 3608]